MERQLVYNNKNKSYDLISILNTPKQQTIYTISQKGRLLSHCPPTYMDLQHIYVYI